MMADRLAAVLQTEYGVMPKDLAGAVRRMGNLEIGIFTAPVELAGITGRGKSEETLDAASIKEGSRRKNRGCA